MYKYLLSYELVDDPRHEYEVPVECLHEARRHLKDNPCVAWADLTDAYGNVVAETEDIV